MFFITYVVINAHVAPVTDETDDLKSEGSAILAGRVPLVLKLLELQRG